jgi:hypothetical protein
MPFNIDVVCTMGALPFYLTLFSIISLASYAASHLRPRQNQPIFTKYTVIGDSYSAGPGAGEVDSSLDPLPQVAPRVNAESRESLV